MHDYLKKGTRIKFKPGFPTSRTDGKILRRVNEFYYLIEFNNTKDTVHFSWLIPLIEPVDIMKEICEL